MGLAPILPVHHSGEICIANKQDINIDNIKNKLKEKCNVQEKSIG